MRRTLHSQLKGDRISLSFPAQPAAVSLARAAAIGLLVHRPGGDSAGGRLAAAAADLVGVGLALARPQDRLLIYFDVSVESVTVGVQLRRRGRWQVVQSRSVALDQPGGGGRRFSAPG